MSRDLSKCVRWCVTVLCVCVATAEEREGKLVTRTVSMPSVRLTASMAKGVSFYMKSQPTLSENEEEVTGKGRGNEESLVGDVHKASETASNLSLYEIYCSWLKESKMIVNLAYSGAQFELECETFRPASTGLGAIKLLDFWICYVKVLTLSTC